MGVQMTTKGAGNWRLTPGKSRKGFAYLPFAQTVHRFMTKRSPGERHYFCRLCRWARARIGSTIRVGRTDRMATINLGIMPGTTTVRRPK